jgi:integrase
MPIRKRKTKSGISWGYYFDLPGSTRENRKTVSASGFATRQEAKEAERQRVVDERLKAEAAARGIPAIPKTVRELLDEFCAEHGDRNLEPKTVERYRDFIPYLAPELLQMPLPEVTPLHLTREWNRLRDCGGHARGSREPRPLSSKTVRNIAGFVSSAFAKAVTWGLVSMNPVTASTRPRGGSSRPGIALSPEQHRLMVEACGHWVVGDILEVSAGLGARRGEVLALRWRDIRGDEAVIGRSICQTRDVLKFKEPKTPSGYRTITVPPSTLAVIDRVRVKQLVFRQQFGPDYRADLDLIFCNPDGTPLKPNSISSTVSALCKKLKLPKGVSLHTERHTHGSQLLAGGMELPAVSARLGHSSPHVTAKVYAHMLQGRDRKAAEIWESMQVPPAPRQHHKKNPSEKNTFENTAPTENKQIRSN